MKPHPTLIRNGFGYVNTIWKMVTGTDSEKGNAVFPSSYIQVRNERRHGWDGWSVGIIVLFVTNRSADPTKVGGGGKKVA